MICPVRFHVEDIVEDVPCGRYARGREGGQKEENPKRKTTQVSEAGCVQAPDDGSQERDQNVSRPDEFQERVHAVRCPGLPNNRFSLSVMNPHEAVRG